VRLDVVAVDRASDQPWRGRSRRRQRSGRDPWRERSRGSVLARGRAGHRREAWRGVSLPGPAPTGCPPAP